MFLKWSTTVAETGDQERSQGMKDTTNGWVLVHFRNTQAYTTFLYVRWKHLKSTLQNGQLYWKWNGLYDKTLITSKQWAWKNFINKVNGIVTILQLVTLGHSDLRILGQEKHGNNFGIFGHQYNKNMQGQLNIKPL